MTERVCGKWTDWQPGIYTNRQTSMIAHVMGLKLLAKNFGFLWNSYLNILLYRVLFPFLLTDFFGVHVSGLVGSASCIQMETKKTNHIYFPLHYSPSPKPRASLPEAPKPAAHTLPAWQLGQTGHDAHSNLLTANFLSSDLRPRRSNGSCWYILWLSIYADWICCYSVLSKRQ